jgi:predicted AAA+ superfamily ATPase
LANIATPAYKIEASLGETIERAIENGPPAPPLELERRKFVLTGGFPELLTRKSSGDEASDLLRSQSILKTDAIEKAIYKDIPQTVPIQDPVKLERLLYVIAGQIAGVFSPNNVAPDLEMSPRTVETYLSYLERAFLIFSLPNFSPSEETVQRRGKKVYFLDGAVRNAALLRGVAPLHDPAEMGLLIENLAAGHLLTLARHTGIRVYHWRRQNAAEVDLLYDHPETPLAFEVGSSATHTMRGCKALAEKHGKYRGNCYFVYPNAPVARPSFDSPGTLPLDMFLLLVGQQTMHAMERRVAPVAQSKTATQFQMSLFDI